MVCDHCLTKAQHSMEQGGVPKAAAESSGVWPAGSRGQMRCPQCKAWITKEGQCQNPRCSRFSDRITRPLASQAQLEAAREIHASEAVDIDSDAQVSIADDGIWVQGWLYVERSEVQSQHFQDAHDDGFVAAARDIYGSDEVEVDDGARVSEADDHVWVQSWLWVSDADRNELSATGEAAAAAE